MKAKAYRPIGTAYIIGRVYCQVKKDKNASLFQIRWLDSQFHSAVEHISVGFVQLGIKNYPALTRVKNPDWRILVRPDPADVIVFEEEASDCEEEMLHAFDPTGLLPTSFAEVEAIKNMRFIPSGVTEGPSYLYQHENGSTQTYMRPEYRHLFEHSASSSFFAYIPLYFWRQVLHETNTYAVVNNIRVATPFTLEELMVFLGILVFMAMNDKGEYANYWGLQAEDLTFGGNTTSLDGIMTLHRFKLLRRCLSFNAVPNTLEKDGAARIRPLFNLLEITGGHGVVHPSEAQDLREELENVSKIRQHVLEVTSDEDNEDDFDTLGNQYGAIESGDEAEKDDVDAGEYDSDQDVEEFCTPEDLVDDVDETEAEIAEEVLFAANFLESFGGADEVLAGNLQNIVLRSLLATGWEDVVKPNIDEHMMGPYHPKQRRNPDLPRKTRRDI
ncbi:ER lumen protein-retaining receptor [Phytophthora nicotianae]|uniref:ER lumen protein-retaining receptor n=1 Tax=Phytophthora nicotianae TaxID=4792 RepID=A0A0W8D4A9_PHYNI|nr:ER lumen protein-retaining receptor [Phytophthora nicotianae]